jgi:hypothetical protein
MMHPSFVERIHHLLMESDVLSRFYPDKKVKCIRDIVSRTLASQVPPSDTFDLAINLEWFRGYFDIVMAITTQQIPVFATLWLYSFIYCIYPYLSRYLLQPEVASRLSVSEILNAYAGKILDSRQVEKSIRDQFTGGNIHLLDITSWYTHFVTPDYINNMPNDF